MSLMSRIYDHSIDLITADLPYGTTKNKWDSVLPLDLLWKQYKRIAKEHTAIILFGQDKFTARVMLSNEKWHRYNLIWKKGNRTTGFLNAKRMPLRNHEDIMVFYKKLPVFHPQFTEGIPLHSMGKKYLDPATQINNNYGKFIKTETEDLRAGSTRKYPKSVLEFERPHPPIHPTQKPVLLMEWIVKTFSNEGEVVLDNTMGIGTTGEACMNTGRHFIGIEKEQKYFDTAKRKLEKYL
jgi:site-specific DNA-methyltransferase (adenine-specific)